MSFHGHMRDKGRRVIAGVALSPEPTATYTPDFECRCRVVWGDTREVMDGSQVAASNVRIHIPLTQDVRNVDRWMVTHRKGKRLKEPELYAVLGQPREVLGEQVLDCKRITDGSAL